MKHKLLLSMLLFSTLLFSQIRFEKGYYLNNNNKKTECLIKNIDWKDNPTFFDYKTDENSAVQTLNINTVKEFEIDGQFKYVRGDVQIDRSSRNLNNLSETREPEFKNETLFLRELTNGDVNLYKYTESNYIAYFISTKSDGIQQLIYKPYKAGESSMIYNKEYKNQLENNLKCSSITRSEIEKTDYREADLKSLINAYNLCVNPSMVQQKKKTNSGKFNLNIRPRVNFSSLEISNSLNNIQSDLGNKTSFSAGIELEYILPFNKNKWALIIEPTYQSYKSYKSENNSNYSGIVNITADYRSIEIPIGVRYYMFLNNNSKLFVNAQYLTDFGLDSKLEFRRADNSELNNLDVRSQGAFAFGLGYNYKSKYAVEFRTLAKRRITSDYIYWTSYYQTTSLILSYNLF